MVTILFSCSNFHETISNCELSITFLSHSFIQPHSFVTMSNNKTIHIKSMDEVGVVKKMNDGKDLVDLAWSGVVMDNNNQISCVSRII